LEEPVREQVDQGQRVRDAAEPHTEEHVPDLGDGRPGQYPLDVVLAAADDRAEHQGERADRDDHGLRGRAGREDRVGPGDQVHPAVTMVAAWISAETGVGPSIASGSQAWSGYWPDLPHAPS